MPLWVRLACALPPCYNNYMAKNEIMLTGSLEIPEDHDTIVLFKHKINIQETSTVIGPLEKAYQLVKPIFKLCSQIAIQAAYDSDLTFDNIQYTHWIKISIDDNNGNTAEWKVKCLLLRAPGFKLSDPEIVSGTGQFSVENMIAEAVSYLEDELKNYESGPPPEIPYLPIIPPGYAVRVYSYYDDKKPAIDIVKDERDMAFSDYTIAYPKANRGAHLSEMWVLNADNGGGWESQWPRSVRGGF